MNKELLEIYQKEITELVVNIVRKTIQKKITWIVNNTKVQTRGTDRCIYVIGKTFIRVVLNDAEQDLRLLYGTYTIDGNIYESKKMYFDSNLNNIESLDENEKILFANCFPSLQKQTLSYHLNEANTILAEIGDTNQHEDIFTGYKI